MVYHLTLGRGIRGEEFSPSPGSIKTHITTDYNFGRGRYMAPWPHPARVFTTNVPLGEGSQ